MRKLLLIPVLLLLLNIVQAQDSNPATNITRVGINLSAIADWSTEFPFVDVFKTARPWISQKEGADWGQGGPLALTPEGWVASLEKGQYAETVLFSSEQYTATDLDGLYTIVYDGEGKLAFRGNIVSIVSEGPGFIVATVNPSEGSVFLQITATNAKDPLRNIRFLLPGAEALYRNQPFSPVLLNTLARFRVIRFMDWMSTNNSAIQEWADRPQLTDATYAWRGVPVEVMVELANTLHADAWFNIPHQASDDYVTQFATYVRDNLDPDLKVYIEYSNETWNGQFAQAQYMQETGVKLHLAQDDAFLAGLRYYSQRSVHIFRIWESVFNDKSRIVRVMAAQAANPWTADQILSWKNASFQTDVLAIAPYFSCDDPGNPQTADDIAALSVADLLNRQLVNVQAGGCAYEYITQNMEIAKQYNVQLSAYEGGQHLAGNGGAENNETLTRLFISANRDPHMGDVYDAYLNAWRDLGGGTFMLFNDVTVPSKFGSWGLLEYLTQIPTTAPKYQAVLRFLDKIGQN